MTVSIKEHSDNVCWFDLRPNDESDFISIYLIKDEKIGLVETGPACSHLTLIEGIEKAGLSLRDIDYVIPTHIHLDHFGGGGHKFAAGAKITNMETDDIIQKIIELIDKKIPGELDVN